MPNIAQTQTNYSHLVLSQAAKAIHDTTPLAPAATPHNFAFALQKFIYGLFGWELPVTEQHIHEMQIHIEDRRPEILAILSSTGLTQSGNLPGGPDCGQSRPFTFMKHTYKFIQVEGKLYLARLELDKDKSKPSEPIYKECGVYSLENVSPTKLKSEALRGYLSYQLKHGRESDLTQFNLSIVDDITKFSFTGAAISPKNLHEMGYALSVNQNKDAGAMIDLRGANLAGSNHELETLDLSKFVIDQNLAKQLIERGVNYQKAFSQYVASQQMINARGFDISFFDLTKVDCTGMDLRKAATKTIIARNNLAEFLKLQNAKLIVSVRESLELALSPSVILTKPAVLSGSSLEVTSGYRFSLEEFVPLAYDLGQLHEKNETLGNIDLRNLRLHRGHVYYSNDGVFSKAPRPTITEKFLDEYKATSEEIDFEIEQPRPLSPVKKDQYDFFGAVFKAVTGQNTMRLVPPNDRFHPGDIQTLYDLLPCSERQKIDWLGFMSDPERQDLHFPLHDYLAVPGTPPEEQVASQATARSERIAKARADAINPQPVPKRDVAAIGPEPVKVSATAVSSADSAAATHSKIQPRREVTNFFELARRNGYQFDVSHFMGLARTLQENIDPDGRSAKAGSGDSTGEATGMITLLRDALSDSIYFEDNQVKLIPECRIQKYPPKQNLSTGQKRTQLEFFGVMINAGLTNPQARKQEWLGVSDGRYLGLSWERRTVVEFVNLLPCDRPAKIQLAKFLYSPTKCSLGPSMETYLNEPMSLVGGPALITEDDVPPDSEPAAPAVVQKTVAPDPKQTVIQRGLGERIWHSLFGSTETNASAKPVAVVPKQVVSGPRAEAITPRIGRQTENWSVGMIVIAVNQLRCNHDMKIQYAKFLMNPTKSPLPYAEDVYYEPNPNSPQSLITVADVMGVEEAARPAVSLIDETLDLSYLSFSEKLGLKEGGTVSLSGRPGYGREKVSVKPAKSGNGVSNVAPARTSAATPVVPASISGGRDAGGGIFGNYENSRNLKLREDDDRF